VAITRLGFTGPTTYGAAVSKPSVSAVPGYIIIDAAYFYDSTSVASISGFSSARAGISAGNQVACTKLWKYYADLSTAPSTFSVSLTGSGGDPILCCGAWSGIDSVSPVPSGGEQTATSSGASTLTVAGGTVAVTDSLAHISCAAWDFSEWSTSSPSGFTRDTGSSTSECGNYYSTALQAIGTSIGATFSGTSGTNEEACVLVVFQPPAASATSHPGESAGMRQLRMNPAYRMSPRSEREAQTFLRARKRAYGFAPLVA
jgi:hypothetical protein